MNPSPPQSERPDMAGYGVTDDPAGLLDWSWAEERLAESRNFWLGTVSASGRPHSMPVWGIWMAGRQRFGFSCAPSARKVRNLAANDQVVVTTEDSARLVSLEGRAVRVDGDELSAMAEAWADKYEDGTWPRVEMIKFIVDNFGCEVIPDRAFGLIETPDEFSSSATRWTWG